MKSWKWVHPDDYAIETRSDGFFIPVICPPGPQRKEKWEEILNWFSGMLSLKEKLRSPDLLPENTSLIIALDDSAELCGGLLAELTNRQIIRLGSIPDIREDFLEKDLVLIGHPHHFNASNIELLTNKLKVRWSILTAADLPGMSFLIAKTILAHCLRRRKENLPDYIAIIDAIDNEITVYTDNKRRYPEYNDRNLSELIDANLHSVIIRAHGEGSHANLNSVVLCSLEDEKETHINGEILHGCDRRQNQRKCKRVNSSSVTIKYFSEIKALNFIFYSCNGFSVSKELYPSNVSCVLSMADGYIVNAMCNDRPGYASREMLNNAAIYLQTDQTVNRLCELENDCQELIEDERPWVIFGDLFPEMENGNDPVSIPYGRINQLTHCYPADQIPVFDLSSQNDFLFPFIGMRKIYFISKEPKHPESSFNTLRDNQSDMQQPFEQTARYARSCIRLEIEELAITKIFSKQINSSGSVKLMMNRIKRIRNELIKVCLETVEAFNIAKKNHLTDTRHKNLLSLTNILVSEWENEFANLAEKLLLDGNTEKIFSYNRTYKKSISQNCQRCNKPLIITTLNDPLHSFDDHFVLNCTTCGPAEAWMQDGPRIKMCLPAVAQKGSKINIEVEIIRERPASEISEGTLVLLFKDKGKQKEFFTCKKRISEKKSYNIEVVMPAYLTSELHTCRALWITGLEIAYCRKRCALIP